MYAVRQSGEEQAVLDEANGGLKDVRNMKKRLAAIILISAFASGCAAEAATSATTTLQPAATSTETNAPSTAMPETEPVTGPRDIAGNSVAYLKYGPDYLAISYVVDGEQRLTGDGGWYFSAAEKLKNAPGAQNAAAADMKSMLDDKSQMPFSDDWYERMFSASAVSCDGDWDIFPVKVRYEKYDADNQPQGIDDVSAFFLNRLAGKGTDSPLIYAEAYYFDWNDDGIGDVLAVAGNVVRQTEEGAATVLPASDKTAEYMISALFVSGCEPVIIQEFVLAIPKEPITEDGLCYSYSDEAVPGHVLYHDLSLLQLDADGKLTQCPVFSIGDYGYVFGAEMVLCDLDGDGVPELVTMCRQVYGPVMVMELENGKPAERYRVTPPA